MSSRATDFVLVLLCGLMLAATTLHVKGEMDNYRRGECEERGVLCP